LLLNQPLNQRNDTTHGTSMDNLTSYNKCTRNYKKNVSIVVTW